LYPVLGDSIVDSLKFTTTKTETFGDAEEVAASAFLPIEEVLNNEWRVDGDDSSYPSTEH